MEGLIRQRVWIDETQCGFMYGRCTTDANLYCTSATGEALGCYQVILHGLRRHVKAFDHVPWDVIWRAMRKLGIDECLDKSMYKDGYCEDFSVGVSVYQSSIPSPLLFITVL